MKAVFRVDSSAEIGTGHLVRCRTLAEGLRRRGAEISFICRDHTGNLIGALTGAGFQVTVLPASPAAVAADVGSQYAAWLGVAEAEDAADTIEALAGAIPDWLIVDHYGLGLEWQRALRPCCHRLMVIDDLCNRPHDCEMLLDQNYSGTPDGRYGGLVSAECTQLLGPRYALLHPAYRRFRAAAAQRAGVVRRILIYFGGVDRDNLSGRSLQALAAPEFRDIAVDLVVGAANPHADDLEKQASKRPNTRLHRMRPHLADLMAAADLSIGAGGATSWERLCLGLPALVTTLAENQKPACSALAADGLICLAGDAAEFGAARIRRLLAELIADPEVLAAQSVRGRNLVDGKGVARVAGLMLQMTGSLSEKSDSTD